MIHKMFGYMMHSVHIAVFRSTVTTPSQETKTQNANMLQVVPVRFLADPAFLSKKAKLAVSHLESV